MSRVRLNETVLQETPEFLKGVDGATVQINKRAAGAAAVYRAETGPETFGNPLVTRDGRIEPQELPGGDPWLDSGSYDIAVDSPTGSDISTFEAINGAVVTALDSDISSYRAALLSVKFAEFNALGDGVADDTAALTAAVAAAYSAGSWLLFPEGDYLTSASIPHLHDVIKIGSGVIVRGGSRFTVDQGPVGTNTLYAAPAGSDVNDGLSSTQPMTFAGAVAVLPGYGPVLDGSWIVQLAAGTYQPVTTPDWLFSRNRIKYCGPNVSGGVPTAIIDASAAGNGFIVGNCGAAWVKDIKVTGLTTSVSATAASFHSEWGSNVLYENCHSQGNGAYAGLSSDGIRCYVKGGVMSGTHQYPVRKYTGVLTVGYGATTPAEGTVISGASFSNILLQNAYADIFYTTLSAAPQNLEVTTNARARVANSSFATASTTHVKAQEGSRIVGLDAAGANTFDGDPANIIRRTGFSTELELHGNAVSEAKVFYDTTTVDHTGTLTETLLKSQLYQIPQRLGGRRLRVVIYGTMSGLGTKTIAVKLLSTDLGTVVSSTDYAGPFKYEVDIHLVGSSAEFTIGRYTENNTAPKMVTQDRAIALTGAQNLRLYATLSNTVGHAVIRACETYEG